MYSIAAHHNSLTLEIRLMKLIGTKKIIGGLALGASLMLTGIVGFAQTDVQQGQDGQGRAERRERGGGKGRHGMRGGMRGFGGHFAEKLNLTDAQKEQMKQIAARYRESGKALRQGRREGRNGGEFGSMTDGTFNEAAVRAAAQARANASVEREVMRARMMSEMFAVLTPEQKAQLAAQRQQWEQKRQEWRSRSKANPVQNQ
jgi:Spy/CpxP family protein refolding chaperone